RSQRPGAAASELGVAGPCARGALLRAPAALRLRAGRRRPRAGGRPTAPVRLGRAPHRRRRSAAPLSLRQPPRGGLVLPHLRDAGGGRGRGGGRALRVTCGDTGAMSEQDVALVREAFKRFAKGEIFW